MDWLDLLAVQGTLKRLLQHHSSGYIRKQNKYRFWLYGTYILGREDHE